MKEYIEREMVYDMLHGLGGCGAEPGSWDNGWDQAIDTAIDELEEIPSAEVVLYKSESNLHPYRYVIYPPELSPCPLCGSKMRFDKSFSCYHGEIEELSIGLSLQCCECGLRYSDETQSSSQMKLRVDSNGGISVIDARKELADKWNTRCGKYMEVYLSTQTTVFSTEKKGLFCRFAQKLRALTRAGTFLKKEKSQKKCK